MMPSAIEHLRVFLSSDGLHRDEVLANLPYNASRSSAEGATGPDPKRYRDPRYVYESIGLLHEDANGIVRLTDLGWACNRWLDILTEGNAPILGRHLSYSLNVLQLRNPTAPGQEYDPTIEVHPCRFIWRAMMELDGRISSDEMNRGIMRTKNETELASAIESIRDARASGDLDSIGQELVTGVGKDDRIIPWMAIASFGWVLISQKEQGFYRIKEWARPILEQALLVNVRHRDFLDTESYIQAISRAASLPPDLRNG